MKRSWAMNKIVIAVILGLVFSGCASNSLKVDNQTFKYIKYDKSFVGFKSMKNHIDTSVGGIYEKDNMIYLKTYKYVSHDYSTPNRKMIVTDIRTTVFKNLFNPEDIYYSLPNSVHPLKEQKLFVRKLDGLKFKSHAGKPEGFTSLSYFSSTTLPDIRKQKINDKVSIYDIPSFRIKFSAECRKDTFSPGCDLEILDYKKALDNMRSSNTYKGSIEAFTYTHNVQDIKKAFQYAKTSQEKLYAENKLIKIMGNDKIFTIIDGKTGASNIQSKGANLLNLGGASMSGKDFSKNFALKSDFLQYGSYRVKVKFNFDAVYSVQEILGKSNQSMHKEMTVVYHLNSGNQYKDTKNINFKGVIVDVQGGAFGVKTYSAKMKKNQLSYKIIGVE